MMKNNKGFTLIELIVVIAIMGVILILALPQISKLQSANKDKKYDAYYSSVESGAKLYMDSQAKDLFGSNSSGCVTVDYSDLKKQNLVKDFGSSDVTCGQNNETYVEVRKVNDNFLYSTSLVCRDSKDSKKIVYERKEVPTEPCTNEPDKAGPTVNITPSEHDWVQTKNLKITVKITDAYTLNKNIGILYYWTNSSGTKVSKDYTYSYKNKKGVKSVSYQIPTKNIPTASGQYKLVVRQWISSSTNGIQDALGNQTVSDATAGLYKIDNVKPTCGSNDGKTTWTNKAFTIRQYCSDDASGCTQNPYSKRFTSSTKTYTFTIKDRAGNTNTCKANVYLDVNKPTCGTNDGKTTWTTQNRKVNVNCKDTGGSGCSQSKFSETFSTDGRTDSITIRDVAGNTTSCTVNKYIDKSAPTCGSVTGQSTSWTKNNRTISVKCSDSLSGCAKNSFSNTFVSTTKTSNITIRDNVGNSRNCSVNVYIDKTPPTCGTVTGSSTQWTNKNRTISVACNDSHSGCAASSYSNTYTTDQKTSNITIKDKLGNSTACPVNVYLDKTKPSISVKFTRDDNGAAYSSGSLADVTIVRNISYSDNLSGVNTIQYNSGGGWATEANTKNYKYTADTVDQYIKFRAIDKAGNSSETSQFHVKIEKDVDKNYNISCSITCHGYGCGLEKPGGGMYYNDSVYKWNLAEAKSGINRSTMGIDYSTDWVHNYCLYNPSNAPNGSRSGCGYAIFNSTTIDYSRSYACSSIVGRACTNKNKCASCTISDRIGC